jgi:hypothetical protein
MPARTSVADRQWSAVEPSSIGLHEWDDECVVYLETQATTHLLDAAASAALKTLLRTRRPISIDELASLSFGTTEGPMPTALSVDEREALESIMLELQRIGIAQAHLS